MNTFMMECAIAFLLIVGEASEEYIFLYNSSHFEASVVIPYEEKKVIQIGKDSDILNLQYNATSRKTLSKINFKVDKPNERQ